MALRMAFRTGRRTDPEVERCRIYALPSPRDMRRCIAWALAEATTSEMGLVVVDDVDRSAGRVRLPGAPAQRRRKPSRGR
jgi:hypothetical protein